MGGVTHVNDQLALPRAKPERDVVCGWARGLHLSKLECDRLGIEPERVTRWLNDVSWADGRYYVAGTQGAVLSSEDGMSWVTEEVITPKSLFALATNGSYLLVAGVEGVILRSPIVPDLTPVQILDFSRIFMESGTAYQNLFLLGGRVDQRFTLDYRESLGVGAWTTGREIEFTDSSGTLYYIETVSTTNATVSEYYRATLIP
jgi:hypothetical protein